MIAVLDYGSQYTQLIAKRLRHLGFETRVLSGRTQVKDLPKNIEGVILSGSPASVGEGFDPDLAFLTYGKPLLGLCFGYQWLAHALNGKVEAALHREYGAALVKKTLRGEKDLLVQGLSPESRVWMSHGDSVTQLPQDAELLLESKGKIAAFKIKDKSIWGLQFHPEVQHSLEGEKILLAFAKDICGLTQNWNLKNVLSDLKNKLREELKGVGTVHCAVSGGVDSTVMATLLSEVVHVKALYVDHGFSRAYDLEDLQTIFRKYPNIELHVIDARQKFWNELNGVSDPEQKRKTIGRLFIETFAENVKKEAANEQGQHYLAQGTIYSDVIESASNDLGPAHKIKSHHNVGGLPEDLKNFVLIEPLRILFKDEVREIGKLLGIPADFLARHPFPGPGLSIRCVGALSPERIEIIRKADAILHRELKARGLYERTWQALCVLLPISTVGVMGDGRTYENVMALRCVSSLDAMTAEATELPWSDLKDIASKIINEVRGINRVVYDLTSKPPGTIEWE